jgi:hypothetical protein
VKIKILLMLFVATCGLIRAQDVPPPPKPQDNRPSLAETMRFIQDKLNGQGSVIFAHYIHDNVVGNDWTDSTGYELSKVQADAAGCKVVFTEFSYRDGKRGLGVSGLFFSLKNIAEIAVMPEDKRAKEEVSKAGHPQLSVRADPPVFVLSVAFAGKSGKSGGVQDLYFYDEALANRVAQALLHAVELCGGGNKEPF